MQAQAASPVALRAQAELERRRRAEALLAYRFEAVRYIEERLGWSPWGGSDDAPGQREIIAAYELALRQQLERNAYEAGELAEGDLTCWQPGQTIRNYIRVEAGHTVGKTKLAAGLVNHFFDTCPPAIIYTFAPTWEQIHDLLWKEIRSDREGKGLPGRILDVGLINGPSHFAKGRATNNAGGTGTERVQGQHGPFLMFVLDEAEGIAGYVFDAVKSMASGGVVIVLLLANPRTRRSRFYHLRSQPQVASFRLSCIHHPNVVQNREVVPGAVRRDYVEQMVDEHAEVVESHDTDAHTFELPWRGRVIYKPDAELMFRVLGIAPSNVSDQTLVPQGRYEAATQRTEATKLGAMGAPHIARIGVDAARWGKDCGTVYVRHCGRVWRAAQLSQRDTFGYVAAVKEALLALHAEGVTDVAVRVDGGGGFGGGCVDLLRADEGLRALFERYDVLEVEFGGAPSDPAAYADLATEMYVEAAEALIALAVLSPPTALESDLCDRRYKWVTKGGVAVRKLISKDEFKADHGRSPDDGDGFCLATAPDHTFLHYSGNPFDLFAYV